MDNFQILSVANSVILLILIIVFSVLFFRKSSVVEGYKRECTKNGRKGFLCQNVFGVTKCNTGGGCPWFW